MRVSAITPTYNRRPFWPRCINYFLSQDYPELEWVILDNGTDPISDLLPNDSRIRYFSVPEPKRTHGELMNLGFSNATGEICIVWDDDDWYAPNRISRQVAPFAYPNILLTGTSRLYYYLHGTRQSYRYQNWTHVPWLASFAMRRSVWTDGQKFQHIPAGADTQLIKSLSVESRFDLNDLSLVVASLHPQNASVKSLPNASFIEVPWEEIKEITGDAL